MALDLYAGPLSRYHSGDWKTIGQQMAEADGHLLLTFQVNDPGAPPQGPPLTQEEVTEDVQIWVHNLNHFMRQQGVPLLSWQDTPDLPYDTDRPGWEGLAGLMFKAAHLWHPEFPEPAIVPDLQELDRDPAFQAAIAQPGLMQVMSDCEMWLPGDFQFVFELETLTGARKMASSLGLLTIALDQVCKAWGMSRDVVAKMHTAQPLPGTALDEAAIHGLCVFCKLAAFATQNNLPLLLD